MRAVDTNVLVRLLTGDDAKQTLAAESFVERGSGGWISHVVLAETVWVLESVYRRSSAQLAATLETLLDHASLVVQEPEVVSGALAQFRRNPKIGFSDCLVLEIARKAGHVPLATFDRALGKLDGARRI